MTRVRPNFHRGFTLIELTVAMAMVAILAVSLYSTMHIAFQAKASAEAAVEPPRTAELAMQFLRNDLQNAVNPGTSQTTLIGPFEGAQGNGGADLTFYSTADSPDHLNANGEVKQIELTIGVPDKSTDQCLLRRVNNNLLATIEPVPDEQVLCRNVAGFSLRYFDGTEWQTSWDSTQQNNMLPAAVEVTLEIDRPVGNTTKRLEFVRVFPLAASTASIDNTLNGLNP